MESVRRYTWVGVLAGMVLGLSWGLPGQVSHGFLQGMLMTLLFFSCLELRPRQIIRDAGDDWARNASVVLVNSLASPLMLLPFRSHFAQATYTGLILSGSMSAGLGVIFLADLLGGSPSRALVLAVTSSVLAPISVPTVVYAFAARSVSIDFLAMSGRTAFIVFVPLVAAVLLGPTAAGGRLLRLKGPASLLIFFTMIVTLVSSVRQLVLSSIRESLMLISVVALLSVICAGLGMLSGKNPRQRMTFAIAASYRNFTLATVLALTLFDEEVALPCVIYVLVGNLMVVALQLFYGARGSQEFSPSTSNPETS